MADIGQKLETKGVIMALLTLAVLNTGCEEQIDNPVVNPSDGKTVEVTLNIGIADEVDGYDLSASSTKALSLKKGAFNAELTPTVATRATAAKPTTLYKLEIRQYDKDGNLKDWWTSEDAKNFKERAQVLVDYFNKIEVLPGLMANGELTLGENIADHGGLQVAYLALQKAMTENPLGKDENGFTPEQRFFLSYGNVWAGNIRDEQIRLQTKSDPHSLGRWRVNAALPHISMWYDAFGVKEGDALYLPVEKRASIW